MICRGWRSYLWSFVFVCALNCLVASTPRTMAADENGDGFLSATEQMVALQALNLDATPRTIARTLNRNGYHWRQVAKKTQLTKKQLNERKAWVTRFIGKDSLWWKQNMHLIFDGVTLTTAPQTFRSQMLLPRTSCEDTKGSYRLQ